MIEKQREIQVCVGNEWYRFPSHYFLPIGFRLAYIPSDFGGLLPKYFPEESLDTPFRLTTTESLEDYSRLKRHATRMTHVIVNGMNDLNQPEMDRFIPINQCDFKVELLSIPKGKDCIQFLNAEETNRFYRIFYSFHVKWKWMCLIYI